MTTLSTFAATANLEGMSSGAPANGLPGQTSGLSDKAPTASVQRFEAALQAQQAPAANPTQAAQAASQTAQADNGPFSIQPDWQNLDRAKASSDTPKTYGELDAEGANLENQRALRGLELDNTVARTNAGNTAEDNRGDLILDGLSHLRSAFDDQVARVGNISSQSMSGTENLIATQVEIVKFSLLMDVTSKLTGKSTQTFDTLMKGQ